jgi:hypothetical protein
MRSVRGMQTRGSHVAGLPIQGGPGTSTSAPRGMDGMLVTKQFSVGFQFTSYKPIW